MFVCKDCGAQYMAHANFCSKCGSSNIVSAAPAAPVTPAAPVAPAAPVQNYAPIYAPQPIAETKKPDLGKGNAISGFIFGMIALFITFIIYAVLEEEFGYYHYSSYYATAFVCNLFLQLPFSIVGLVNSAKARTLRGLSIVGLVASIICLVTFTYSGFMFLNYL